jgi:hypothetical protein
VALQFFATGVALGITAWYLAQRDTGRSARGDACLPHDGVDQDEFALRRDFTLSARVVDAGGPVVRRHDPRQGGSRFVRRASQLSTLVGFGSTAIMLIAQPMIADLYARGKIDELIKLSRQIVLLALLASIPVFLGVLVLGRPCWRAFTGLTSSRRFPY